MKIITKDAGLVSVTLFNSTYSRGYFAVSISQMTQAHLHASSVSINGPPLAWAFNATYGPISGSIRAPFTFNPSLNNITSLLKAGLVYFNVHTLSYPAGEIRGQMISTVPQLDSENWLLRTDSDLRNKTCCYIFKICLFLAFHPSPTWMQDSPLRVA